MKHDEQLALFDGARNRLIKIAASKTPKFKAGKALKDLVNGKKK